MSKLVWIVPTLIAIASPAYAEQSLEVPQRPQSVETNDDETAPEPAPAIVVHGSADRRMVLTGSRLPRAPVRKDGPVATDTGVMGLVPGSGMDPFAGGTRKITTKTCRSDGEAISKEAACLLAKADRSWENGDAELGASLLRSMADEDHFNAEERLAASQRLYAIGDGIQSRALREEALIKMIDTGLLPQSDAIAAHRTLVAMAMKRAEPTLAVSRLESLLSVSPGRAQDWVNLAVLQRRLGDPASRTSMLRAIDLNEAAGRPIDPSWRSFLES